MTGQRLFVAVDPPRYAVEHLARAVRDLHVTRAGARVVPADRWHLTVAFLGNVADDRVAPVEQALARAASGAGIRRCTLWLEGGGSFRGRESVLWTGLAGEVEQLGRVARAVKRELRQIRFSFERRPYRPHLTIARPGRAVDRRLVDQDVATLAAYRGPEWTAAELYLVRSHLGPRPRYERVAEFSLPSEPAR